MAIIKNKRDYIKALSKLKPEDKEDLKFCRDRIQKIIDSSKVSEESIQELFNITSQLSILNNKWVGYNIAWLKQGFMEDN